MIFPHPSIDLNQFKGSRTNSATLLTPIIINGKKYCSWCGANESKNKYCSEECQNFVYTYLNPQSNHGMSILFENLQMAVCVGCGLDYEDYLKEGMKKVNEDLMAFEKRMEEFHKNFPEHPKTPPVKFLTSIYDPRAITEAKKKIPELDSPEIDHIVAIKLGGQGAGFDNLQVLCCRCHKEKTKEDNIKISSFKKSIPNK